MEEKTVSGNSEFGIEEREATGEMGAKCSHCVRCAAPTTPVNSVSCCLNLAVEIYDRLNRHETRPINGRGIDTIQCRQYFIGAGYGNFGIVP